MTPRHPLRTRRAARALGALAATLAFAGACAFGPPPPDQSGAPPNLPPPPSKSAQPEVTQASTLDVVASKLTSPWGMAFLPDATALVTERTTGRIVHLVEPAGPDGLAQMPLGTVPGISAGPGRGLLGIAVSPHFGTDHSVYVFYTTATDNRIGRITLPTDLPDTAPSSSPSAGPTPTGPLTPKPVLTGIPRGTTGNGGALAFGPDGQLYASTGDAGQPALAADPSSLAGKILRITPAGAPAPGNPHNTRVYASGLHDPQGFDWTIAGAMYTVDAGRTVDRLLKVDKGGTYGWPETDGTSEVHAAATWPLVSSTCAGVAVIDPIVATACPVAKQMWIVRVTNTGTPIGAPTAFLEKTYGRLRGAVTAPDGSLWVSTSNTDGQGTPGAQDDRILRIVFSDAGGGLS